MFVDWEVRAIMLMITQAEDRATLRSDLSAVLGPKSKRDGWKRFQPLAFVLSARGLPPASLFDFGAKALNLGGRKPPSAYKDVAPGTGFVSWPRVRRKLR